MIEWEKTEIDNIIKFVRKGYNKRLPELESIVTKPTLYCKALLEIESTNPAEMLVENKDKLDT